MASVPHAVAPEMALPRLAPEAHPAQPVGSRAVRVASRPQGALPPIATGSALAASPAVAPRAEAPPAPAKPAGAIVANRLFVSLAPPSPAILPAKPAAAVPAAAKAGPAPRLPAARSQVVAQAAAPSRVPVPKRVVVSRKALSQKPGEPLLFAWDPKSKPNAEGRYEMRVFRGRTTPWQPERVHSVKAGETLQGIARACHVTPRSILVASGLPDQARIHNGMTLRVPGTFDVVLNDQKVAFDVAPRIDHGMPLAPFRQIMEYSGGVVLWFEQTQEVRGTNEHVDVQLKIGSRQAVVNNKPVVLDKAPFIDSGRTMVPIRFVEEALDLRAEYDTRTGSIYLVKK
jgi:hypothetical protein